jgi:hypothetical protein
MKKLLALGFVAASLMTACDAPGTTPPSAQNSPKPTATSTPTPQATTNPNPQPTAATTVSVGTDAFAMGRKWVYALTTKAATVNTTGEITIEVVSVTADQATIKVTSTVGGVTTSNSSTVARNSANPWAGVNLSGSANTNVPTATSQETISVMAGTFACTKNTFDISKSGVAGTADMWFNSTQGLVKQVMTIKPALPAGLPAGFSFDLTSVTTLELKSVT